MGAQLDHLILAVNDRQRSLEFYTGILGFRYEGERPPFAVVRVTPDFVLQLAPWGTNGGEHLAFAMTRPELDQVFARVRDAGIAYGDAFDAVGNLRGPGQAEGAHGPSTSLYFFDPNEHLIEVMCYG
jgi:catechol 2,3-dioxygenase-like lactoylglutathione lyase family enzyme